ncbi:DUF1015 family protein [Psychrilyobacter atlanticus]|uniref:DUF1015 family protein n=1 Tax=Psychrilyobacter atlanticus TaxID=271091 RepID=UPI000419B452|nr:DUF1015 family protein [Psychrilyobacter atlanticus]
MPKLKPFKGYRLKNENLNKLVHLNHSSLNKLKILEKEKLVRLGTVNGKMSDHIELLDREKDIYYNDFLVKDLEDSYYIYSYGDLITKKEYRGILGKVLVRDYLNGNIKTHELTRDEKITDMVKNLKNFNSETAPVFLTFKKQGKIDELLFRYSKDSNLIHTVIMGNIEKKIWKISKKEEIEQIQKEFKKIETFYIADGHHRSYSKSKYSVDSNFLAVVFSEDQIEVLDYNRLVVDFNGRNLDDIFEEIEKDFELIKTSKSEILCRSKNDFVIYVNKTWNLFNLRKGIRESLKEVEEKLDVSILQNYVLDPIFDIKNPTRDKRIKFFGGLGHKEKLVKEADKENGVAFFLYPTGKEEFFQIADQNKIMPPKSTWFEPKIASGIIIHKYKEGEE